VWVFATIGSLTAASRCTWAFSRDGGIPGSQWWRVVNPRFGVPLNSLILSTVVCALLGLIYLGSSAAFNAFTGGECLSNFCNVEGGRGEGKEGGRSWFSWMNNGGDYKDTGADGRSLYSRNDLPRLFIRFPSILLPAAKERDGQERPILIR